MFDLSDFTSCLFRSQRVGMVGVWAALGGGARSNRRAVLCIPLQWRDRSPAALCDGSEGVQLAEAQRAAGGSAGGREQHAVSLRPGHFSRH